MIIALDERNTIAGGIGPVRFGDEVWIVDSGSTIRAAAIAKSVGAAVICNS